MPERYINVQLSTLTDADIPELKAYSGSLLVCDWETDVPRTLSILDAAGVQVKIFRWTQDPRHWGGWPHDYIDRCNLALFGNEPDIEHYPDWYIDVCRAWTQAGGKLALPAYSDETKRPATETITHNGQGIIYTVKTAHCYAGNFANLATVRQIPWPSPIIITEYARQHEQHKCLYDLSGIPEPTAIFAYRWKEHAADGYDVAGITYDPPPAPQPAAQAPIPPVLYSMTTTTPTVSMPLTIPQIHRIGGHPMPVQTPIAFMQPASSADCWADNGRRFFTRYGIITDLELWYQVAKGKSRPPGGEPATFGELKAAIITVAEHQGITIGVAPASYQSGYAYLQMLDCTDPGQVSACLDDPDVHNPWSIIAGINAWDLGMLNADGSRATWGHYITLRKRQADDATYIWVFDPANQWNGDSAQTYPWADIVTAMADNWTGPNGLDAIAVKVVEVPTAAQAA